MLRIGQATSVSESQAIRRIHAPRSFRSDSAEHLRRPALLPVVHDASGSDRSPAGMRVHRVQTYRPRWQPPVGIVYRQAAPTSRHVPRAFERIRSSVVRSADSAGGTGELANTERTRAAPHS